MNETVRNKIRIDKLQQNLQTGLAMWSEWRKSFQNGSGIETKRTDN
jgi:hypothetical protein